MNAFWVVLAYFGIGTVFAFVYSVWMQLHDESPQHGTLLFFVAWPLFGPLIILANLADLIDELAKRVAGRRKKEPRKVGLYVR